MNESVSHEDAWSRSRLLIGEAGLEKLSSATVAVCGLGGVGSYIAEALARSGIGGLILADHDTVAESNINRQLCALHSNIGQYKADIMAERIRDIAPACRVSAVKGFIDAGKVGNIIGQVDFIADAIDYLPGKAALVQYAREKDIPIICAMGAGRRLDPSQLRIADISASHTCPLAKRMRKLLREQGIEDGVTVAFSTENPLPAPGTAEGGKATVGSMVFVPAVMGLLIAGHIVRELL